MIARMYTVYGDWYGTRLRETAWGLFGREGHKGVFNQYRRDCWNSQATLLATSRWEPRFAFVHAGTIVPTSYTQNSSNTSRIFPEHRMKIIAFYACMVCVCVWRVLRVAWYLLLQPSLLMWGVHCNYENTFHMNGGRPAVLKTGYIGYT